MIVKAAPASVTRWLMRPLGADPTLLRQLAAGGVLIGLIVPMLSTLTRLDRLAAIVQSGFWG